MLNDIKDVLRVSTPDLDVEIGDLISAAVADLMLSGVQPVKASSTTDPLVRRAVACYCKAHFGYDNAEADRFNSAYLALKAHMTLTEEYGL